MPANGLTCVGKRSYNKGRITPEKKRGTRKNTLIASGKKYIYYLGKTVAGSIHDYELLKSELDVNLGLFEGYRTLVDLGYLGMNKDYFCEAIQLPHRKPRQSKSNPNTTLTPQQKQENRSHARLRIKIEHALAGVKRLGAVSQVYRNKSIPFNDLVMGLACSLWNFHLKNKQHPI